MDREVRYDTVPPGGEVTGVEDTLQLYFLCAHPDLTPSSAVALTLRAVGGLTTRQIAGAYLVPDATMAQRISRAKRIVGRAGLDRPGDVRTVMQVLYLVFNEGYSGDIDLAAEAIRLTRQLAAQLDAPEVGGLLALMLLHHARRPSRTRADGSLVPLAEQDRTRWDTELVAEGIAVLQAALARDQLGEYQAQAAIAALHATRRRWRPPTGSRSSSGTTSCSGSPTRRSSGSTGPSRSARPTAQVPGSPRWPTSTSACLDAMPSRPTSTSATATWHSPPGSTRMQPATRPSLAEHDHLTRQAVRLNQQRQHHR